MTPSGDVRKSQDPEHHMQQGLSQARPKIKDPVSHSPEALALCTFLAYCGSLPDSGFFWPEPTGECSGLCLFLGM